MAFYLTNMSRRRIIASQPNDITREGSIVSFGTNIARPMQVTCALTPVQSGSGDPSPSNIRPITGWTGCDVTGAGVNLWDKTSGNVLNMSIVNANVLSNSGNAKTVYIPCKSNTTYTVSKNAGLRFTVAYIKTEPANNVPVYGRIVDNSGVTSLTITTGDNAKYLVAYIFNSTYDTGTAQDMIDSVQIEKGSTASTYSAYTGTTIPIVWQTTAGTVYGGTMTLNRDGSVTVVATHKRVDLGSLSWTKVSNRSRGYATVSDMETTGSAEKYDIICDSYKSATWDDNVCAICHFNAIIRISNPAFADMTGTQIGTALDGVYAVYPLATPLTYTLSASVLNSLAGQNNVWADAGDVSVKAWGF